MAILEILCTIYAQNLPHRRAPSAEPKTPETLSRNSEVPDASREPVATSQNPTKAKGSKMLRFVEGTPRRGKMDFRDSP